DHDHLARTAQAETVEDLALLLGAALTAPQLLDSQFGLARHGPVSRFRNLQVAARAEAPPRGAGALLVDGAISSVLLPRREATRSGVSSWRSASIVALTTLILLLVPMHLVRMSRMPATST